MFFGTTPNIIAQFLSTEFLRLRPKRVVVPFAGNFVVEQIASLAGKSAGFAPEILSTDVSLYSRAIGFGITDTPFHCSIKPHVLDDFPFFADKTTPLEIAAMVIFFAEVAKNLGKEHIPYYASLNRNAKASTEAYFGKILQQLSRFKENTARLRFFGTDACEVLPLVENGDVVFYDPPVLLGDYEKMFAPLAGVFDFTEPSYTEMTDEVKQHHLRLLRENGATVYYRTNNPLAEPPQGYTEVFRYQYKWHAHYCVYASCVGERFSGRFQPIKEEVKPYPLIGESDVITAQSRVEIVPVSGNVGNHYRMMWVKKAEMGNMGTPLVVLVDGKIAGLLVLESGLKFGTDLVLIVSDPAAPTSRYKRLSKLMLHLCCTRTVLDLINERTMWEHTGFTTRVLTNNPVSMKYRGLFDLAKREEFKEGNYEYKLIYQSKTLFPDVETALAAWLKKDGKVVDVAQNIESVSDTGGSGG
jgi:hypothetical protein